MVYEGKYKYRVGIDDMDRNFNMTNMSIIKVFQNLASFASDDAGYGIVDIPRTHLTWIVLDWQIEVIRRPKYSEEVELRTWGRNIRGCYSYRDFEMYHEGKLCAIATTKWMLINTETRMPETVPENFKIAYAIDDDLNVFNMLKFDRMHPLEKYDEESKIVIRKSDLDFNNHVNNVKYFDFIKTFTDKEFDNMRITYRKEIKETDDVSIYHSSIDGKEYFLIKDTDNVIKTMIECC